MASPSVDAKSSESPSGGSIAARAATPAARFLVVCCGWWLVFYSFLTVAEILARKFLGKSIQGVDEIGGYTLAVVSALGFAWALVSRAHTRVDFLLGRLDERTRAILNAAAYVTLALVAALAALKGWDTLAESIEFRSRSTTPLQLPLWIPQSAWFAGIAFFAATSAAMAVEAVVLLVANRRELNRRFGTLTVEEEIAVETGGLIEIPAPAKRE
jgi:TRAP-type C4-dicarboxylate transport system permease small subunit